MKYENLIKSNDKEFRRATGVKRKTFEVMVKILKDAQKLKRTKGGRPNKLTVEEMLLMALEYLREYRTYLSISKSYGLSESNTFEAIRWVENTLVNSGEFKLPGKKALLKSDNELTVILVDATESPIERPKKNNANSIRERKNDIRLKHKSL
jgi:hypothetical protein